MPTPSNTQFAVAVHALAYLAGMGDARPISSDELSESANVNPVHVRRVLGPLRRAGLVSSSPGAHGGWVLHRPAADLPLVEIWDLLQGDDPVLAIHGPNPDCPVGRGIQTALAGVEQGVRAAVRAEFADVTVQNILDGAGGAPSFAGDRRTVRSGRPAPQRDPFNFSGL